MDVANLLISAAVSAFVGSVVSLIAVSQMTIRKARAERAEEAKNRIQTLIAPLRLEVLQYKSGLKDSAKREPDMSYSADYILASRVLSVASDLPWVRRVLVRRRSRRLFGKVYTDLAQIIPVGDEPTLGESLAPQIVYQLMHQRQGIPLSASTSFLNRALQTEPDSRYVKKLGRELAWLARGR